MKKMILIFLAIFLTLPAFSQSKISYHVEVNLRGEYIDIDENFIDDAKAQGWKIKENDDEEIIFVASGKDLPLSDSPLTLRLDSFYLIVVKTVQGEYKLTVGNEYGDYDGAAIQSTYLNVGKPNVITLSGGDYASGAWMFDTKAIIHLKL